MATLLGDELPLSSAYLEEFQKFSYEWLPSIPPSSLFLLSSSSSSQALLASLEVGSVEVGVNKTFIWRYPQEKIIDVISQK